MSSDLSLQTELAIDGALNTDRLAIDLAPPDRRLTASAIRSYLDCPRKYEFAYEQRIRPIKQHDALRFGSLFHDVFEHLDNGMTWTDVCRRTLAQAATDIEAQQVLRLAAEHHRHYGDDGFEIEETEGVFTADIGGVPCTGKRDRVVVLPDGRRAVQEYKTSSEDIEPGSIYWRRLRMDIQVSIYLISSGAETIIYDVTRKPTIKPRQIPLLDSDGIKQVRDDETGERVENKNGKWKQAAGPGLTLVTREESADEYGDRLTADIQSRPDYYFQRQEIARMPEDSEAAVEDVQAVDALIRLQLFPRNTASCTRYGECPYFTICSVNAKPADGVPVGFERLKTAHPELSDAPTTTTA